MEESEVTEYKTNPWRKEMSTPRWQQRDTDRQVFVRGLVDILNREVEENHERVFAEICRLILKYIHVPLNVLNDSEWKEIGTVESEEEKEAIIEFNKLTRAIEEWTDDTSEHPVILYDILEKLLPSVHSAADREYDKKIIGVL